MNTPLAIARPGRLRRSAALFFPGLYLFVLPYAHVTALRSIGFAGTVAILIYALAKRAHAPLPLKAPLAFWLLAALASIPISVDLAFTLRDIREDVLYGIATFYAFFVLTRSAADLRRWRKLTIASMGLIGVLAIIGYAQRGAWAYGYQNFLGQYSTFIVTALPLLGSAFFAGALRGGRWERVAAVVAALLGLSGGLLARSRALWVVVAASALAASALYALKDWKRRRTLVLAGVATVVVALAAGILVSRERDLSLDRLGIRTQIYAFDIHTIARHPFYGTGFGPRTDREAYRKRFPGMGILHAHDLLFSYTEQMGVWGALALLWLFGALAVAFWRAWRSSRPDLVAVGTVGLTLLVAVLLKNSTDMFFTGQLLLLFWAYMGILLGYEAHNRELQAAV